ncbi:MAG TPA: 7-carboxy-7-deazaguanine synthase QueE [Deltaproteobacteria bacterium]|nr:7-carboxy-7-deazaguanine synthase QueE [Deltaproteobacteria bacterium]
MKSDQTTESTLLILEIFHSLQGEGPWAGLPATFIRLAGCIEPFCPWCDTPYALGGGEEMSISSALESVRSRPGSRVVITGGEPFCQWERGLSQLHEALVSQGCEVQYETSGKAGIPDVKDALVVCSPKFLDRAWRFDPKDRERVDFFKFLAAGSDWPEAIDGFVEKHGIDHDRVYVMALGATRQEQIRGMKDVFAFCAARGYRMSPRLHVLAFDTERGV